MKKLLFGVLIWLAASHGAMAEMAGTVIGVKPDSFAVRASQELPLNLRDSVEPKDSLRTGSNGRLEVLFNDESSIKLGPNTLIAITDFLPGSSAPVLHTHVSEGIARFITGTITEHNPDGFVVTTPEATIGVRGTVFFVETSQGHTTVETLSGLTLVNGVPLEAGNRAIIGPGGSLNITPLNPAVIQATLSELNTTNREVGDGKVIYSPALLPMPVNTAPTDLAMEDVSSDLLVSQSIALFAPPAATYGVISGNMLMDGINSSGYGQYGFSFNLTSGAVSNGWMSGTIANPSEEFSSGVLTASGGSGTFDGDNSFRVENFSGTWDNQALSNSVEGTSLQVNMQSRGGIPGVGTQVDSSNMATGFNIVTLDHETWSSGGLDGSRTQ